MCNIITKNYVALAPPADGQAGEAGRKPACFATVLCPQNHNLVTGKIRLSGRIIRKQ